MTLYRFVLAALCAVLALPALALDYRLGAIEIGQPWARATPPTAESGGGFLAITNTGTTPDRLIAVKSPAAAKVEIHEMKSENGVMEMREITGGLAIPAHGSVGLAPGGYHLMLTHLAHPLTKGDTIRATLAFERAGPVEVEFKVLGVGAAATGGGSSACRRMVAASRDRDKRFFLRRYSRTATSAICSGLPRFSMTLASMLMFLSVEDEE